MIKFYTGNVIPGIGQAFVIISAKRDNDHFISEDIILFKAADGRELSSPIRAKQPLLGEMTLNDFVDAEMEQCKRDIFYKIIFRNFPTEVERAKGNIHVLLTESSQGTLVLLKDKFPTLLRGLKNITQSEELKALIGLYESIKIERDDFEIKRT